MLRLSSSFRFWYSKRSSFHSILNRTFGLQLPDISFISMIVLKWAWSQTVKHQIRVRTIQTTFRAVNLSLWTPPRYQLVWEVSPWRKLPSRPPSRESCSPARPMSPSPRSPPPRHTGSWYLGGQFKFIDKRGSNAKVKAKAQVKDHSQRQCALRHFSAVLSISGDWLIDDLDLVICVILLYFIVCLVPKQPPSWQANSESDWQ